MKLLPGYFVQLDHKIIGGISGYVKKAFEPRREYRIISFLGRFAGRLLLVRDTDITRVLNSTKAPLDIRNWPNEYLSGLLHHETQIDRFYLGGLKNALVTKGTGLMPPVLAEQQDAWEYAVNSRRQSDSDLRLRLESRSKLALPQHRAINARVKKRVETRQQELGGSFFFPGTHLSTLLLDPAKAGVPHWGKKARRPPPKIDLDKLPDSWPESFLVNHPAEAYALSGKRGLGGLKYKTWYNKVGKNAVVPCPEGELAGCTCSHACRSRYKLWLLGDARLQISWLDKKREYVRCAKEALIIPLDWPEGNSIIGTEEETIAVNGLIGHPSGLQYRVWFKENFNVLNFRGNGPRCDCRGCKDDRYHTWFCGKEREGNWPIGGGADEAPDEPEEEYPDLPGG